jgi:predicted ribonuclease YlaK
VEWAIDTHLKNVKMFLNPEDSFNRGGHKIVIAKPHVNSGGESYGHLPGDINQKIDPTIINFTQYFDRLHQAGYEKLRDAGYVEILPLGFVRGMDASNVTVIADECQNTKELITLVTRKSNKSRIILLGDTSPFQIDKAGNTPDKNGLTDVIDLLRGATYFQHIEMKTVEHVVRSEETRDVVRRLFKKHGHDIAAWGTTQRG